MPFTTKIKFKYLVLFNWHQVQVQLYCFYNFYKTVFTLPIIFGSAAK